MNIYTRYYNTVYMGGAFWEPVICVQIVYFQN